jgi:hypothetical protein
MNELFVFKILIFQKLLWYSTALIMVGYFLCFFNPQRIFSTKLLYDVAKLSNKFTSFLSEAKAILLSNEYSISTNTHQGFFWKKELVQ